MKNKNTVDRTANDVCNLIVEIQKLRGNGFSAYAYATGVLIAIIEAARRYQDNIQDVLNRQYESFQEELDTFEPLTAVTDYPTD